MDGVIDVIGLEGSCRFQFAGQVSLLRPARTDRRLLSAILHGGFDLFRPAFLAATVLRAGVVGSPVLRVQMTPSLLPPRADRKKQPGIHPKAAP